MFKINSESNIMINTIVIIMTSFNIICFVPLLLALASYLLNNPLPKFISLQDQTFLLNSGETAMIWNNPYCIINPIEKWATIILTKPNNRHYQEVIYQPICISIDNGDSIKSHDNSINVFCTDKCV